MIVLIKPVSDRVHPHPTDNGKEFAEEKVGAQELKEFTYLSYCSPGIIL
jgi:hypothetical protein